MSIGDFAQDEKPKTEWDNKDKPESKEPTPEGPEEGGGESAEGSEVSADPKDESPNATTTTSVDKKTPAPTQTAPATEQPNVDDILASALGKIGDIGSDALLKCMIFGDPGSTKSSWCATAPNNLIFDFEDGMVAAKHSKNGIAEGVKVVPYTNWKEFTTLLGALINGHPSLDWVETITIDTISEMHKRSLAEIMRREKLNRPSINEFVPETEQYTEVNEKVTRIVRALRDTRRHLIITAHAKTIEPKNKPAKTIADFSEKLNNNIMGMMDLVGHMEMRSIDKVPTPIMRVISDGTIHSKNRLGLPQEIKDPTWPQIYKAWAADRNTTT